MKWWHYCAIGAALLFLLYLADGDGVVADLLATITGRGARVGPATAADALGVIPDDPESLARAAALSLDVYALARAISSEEGNQPTLYKLAVGWAMTNKAGGSPAHLLLAGRGPTEGRFAAQNARYLVEPDPETGEERYMSAGKYASTARDPHEDDVKIATGVLSRAVPDPTGGATNFFSPAAQDAAFDAGRAGYNRDAAALEASWIAGGLSKVDVPGIEPRNLTFFRRGGMG